MGRDKDQTRLHRVDCDDGEVRDSVVHGLRFFGGPFEGLDGVQRVFAGDVDPEGEHVVCSDPGAGWGLGREA